MLWLQLLLLGFQLSCVTCSSRQEDTFTWASRQGKHCAYLLKVIVQPVCHFVQTHVLHCLQTSMMMLKYSDTMQISQWYVRQ